MSHIYSSAMQSATEFHDIHPPHQIMRKKPDTAPSTITTTSVVSNKIISKPPRSKSASAPAALAKKNVTLSTAGGQTAPLAGCAVATDTHSENVSAGSSRDRSPTPLESDLLRYLTAHITPMHKEENKEFYVDVTSFVIGRDEYLQGIVRLVQSDCPEVSGDLKCFVQAMQQAFCVVSDCDRGI